MFGQHVFFINFGLPQINKIMNIKSFFLSGIAGTAISFFLGLLFYNHLFTDIFPDDAEQCVLFIFLGYLYYAFTFTLIFSRWKRINTFKSGAKAGFLIGLLWSLSMSFFMYASMSGLDFNFTIIVAIDSVSAAIMGGVIAFVAGNTKA